MPSPFPGMDPYLEQPGLWPDVHHALISEIQAYLNRLLRPKYHVRVEERVYVSEADDPGREAIVPDLRVAERVSDRSTRKTPAAQAAHAATAEVTQPVVLTTLIDDEIHEARLEVVDRDLQTVVTVIEVVSPTNKIPGARGRVSYQEKKLAVMKSPSHWVEIDLLRRGAPLVAREVLPQGDYFVHVSRVSLRPKGEVWPIRLRDRLPVIAIPLRPGDPDARLDLQQVLDAAYDRAAYDLEIDYRAEPNPPLTPEDAHWADEWLVAKGLRPGG